MACSLPHTIDKIQALIYKLIDEDKARQNAITELAMQFNNASTAKDNLRKAYEKCNDISQESQESVDEHDIGDEYPTDGNLTEKEQHQLLLDEEALRETLEEAAMAEKE
ncbi:hypothetical protein Tco_0807783 [Tanacetum coccineum]